MSDFSLEDDIEFQVRPLQLCRILNRMLTNREWIFVWDNDNEEMCRIRYEVFLAKLKSVTVEDASFLNDPAVFYGFSDYEYEFDLDSVHQEDRHFITLVPS